MLHSQHTSSRVSIPTHVRRFEFQADAFAVRLQHGKELRAALLRLEEENKSSMNVDPWFSAYHYSHPPLVERLKAIDAGCAKTE